MRALAITHHRTVRTGSAEQFALAAASYRQRGHLKLAGLLDPHLLDHVLKALDEAEFYDRVHDGIGLELCVSPGPLTSALELAFNDPVLFSLVEELTGCGPIGCFEGRVYRMTGGGGHYDSWHSDVGQDRLAALSVNLGRLPYEGGALQIRRVHTPDAIEEVENPIAGDAVLFRVDPEYCHRVAPLVGQGSRTAYAGWFRAQPDYRQLMAARIAGRS